MRRKLKSRKYSALMGQVERCQGSEMERSGKEKKEERKENHDNKDEKDERSK